MRTTTRFIVAALIACVALAMYAGAASARTRVEVSTTAATGTSSRLTFAGTINIICDVTLEGTFLRLINKRLDEHVGEFTRAITARCTDSSGRAAEVVPLIPMRMTYSNITGTLPTITGGRFLVEAGFLIEVATIFGQVDCLYRGRIGAVARENPVRRLTVETTAHGRIPLFQRLAEANICPASGDMIGTFNVRPEITIRLLER